MIDSIASLASGATAAAAHSPQVTLADHVDQGEGSAFANWFDAQIDAVDDQIRAGDEALRSLALGETSNIHHVMMALEKARLSMSLVVEVRNKALEGYQEMMRMQL